MKYNLILTLLFLGISCKNNTQLLQNHQNDLFRLYSEISMDGINRSNLAKLDSAFVNVNYLIKHVPTEDIHHYHFIKAQLFYLKGATKDALKELNHVSKSDSLMYRIYSGIIHELGYNRDDYLNHYQAAKSYCLNHPSYPKEICYFANYLLDRDKTAYLDSIKKLTSPDTLHYHILKVQLDVADEGKARRDYIYRDFIEGIFLPDLK